MTTLATRHQPLATRRSAAATPSLSFQVSSLRPPRKSSAFTLIELLVVIAILVILAGIAFPAMQGAMDSAKRGQARNDVHQIATAVKAYRLEFGRLPTKGQEIAELTGDNPKQLIFLEAKNAKGDPPKAGLSGNQMYNPWGETYTIVTDESGRIDGHITTVLVSTKDNKNKTISNVD
jgi:type II secretion system protein G